MTNRWNEVEALFHRAADLPEADRGAFLADACEGDSDLRREVESLLVQEPASGSDVMGGPAFDEVARALAGCPPLVGGQQIGAYAVVALVGRGGMGEVYRARDTQLGRDVALKMLPGPFALDADRTARFDQEARLLAALNHPNIATIHGIEELNGQKLLVLEFVEGQTLAERLREGPIPLHEALAFALQIAGALESAHEKGVVHRDLKPANVKITPEGRIKVLDFGLAKTLSHDDRPGPSDSGPAPRPEHTHRGHTQPGHTQKGTLLGTAAYMAPEQAKRGPVDRRADIWAFGCVLYEMLTGRSPFSRDTVEATLAEIQAGQPDLTALPPETPSLIRRLVRRCLEKNPRDRLQHIGDARADIQDALAEAAPSAVPSRPLPPRDRAWPRWAKPVGWVVLLLAAGILLGRFLVEAPGPVRVVRLPIPAPEAPFHEPYGMRTLAVSNDGGSVVYAGLTGLWIRRLDQNDAVRLNTPPASDPFFSPDGEWIGFFLGGGAGGGLARVPADGGPWERIAAVSGGRPFGGDWQDGTIVFAASEGLFTVPADGSESPRLLVGPDTERQEVLYAWPQFMPDGQSVLFTVVPEGPIEGAQVALLDLEVDLEAPGPPRVVLRGGTGARYISTGHLVYASGSSLMGVRFDPLEGTLEGDPMPVPQVQVSGDDYSGVADFAVSGEGTLAYIPPTEATLREVVVVDRNGNSETVVDEPGSYSYVRLSGDQTRLALDARRGGGRDIWIWDRARGEMTPLTRSPLEDLLPLWSPDSSRVFFGSDRNGRIGIYSRPADGSTPDRLEFGSPGFEVPGQFTPDGQGMFVFRSSEGNPGDVYLRRLGDPDDATPVLTSEFRESLATLSPDGNWILYQSDELGDRFEIFLRPYPETSAARYPVSLAGGIHPRWAPDGTEIYYRDLRGALMAVAVRELAPAPALETPEELFPDFPYPGVSNWSYDLWPGRGFLMTRPVTGSDDSPDISVVLGWSGELEALLPAR